MALLLLLTSVAIWVGMSTGCSADPAPQTGSAVIDTVGSVIHTRNTGAGLWSEETRWNVVELTRIGAREEPKEELFASGLIATAMGPDGNIYVLDYQAALLSVFDQEGHFVRTIGRRGRGPSEFVAPTGMTWDGLGRIWVVDAGAPKYVVFDPEGGFVRTHPRLTQVVARRLHQMYYSPEQGIVDEASEDGALLYLQIDTAGVETRPLARVERTGGATDAVINGPRPRAGGAFQRLARNYVSRMKWAVAPDGTIWTADSEELLLVQRALLSGDTLRVVSTDHRRPTFTLADESLILDAQVESGLSRRELAPVWPIIQTIHVMDDGHLLVQVTEVVGEASPVFDVFDPEGRYLGEIDLGFAPTPFGLSTSRGDLFLSPMLGQFDVPYAVLVRLERPDRDQ